MSREQAQFLGTGYASTGMTVEEYRAFTNWLLSTWGQEISNAFIEAYRSQLAKELGQQ